jgi:hypothetical protein
LLPGPNPAVVALVRFEQVKRLPDHVRSDLRVIERACQRVGRRLR